MSVRVSVALIKKEWKSIVPIIPVGPGCESANGHANPFWHVQHKPQCHSGHLPILSAYPSLFPSPPSLSHRITAADKPSFFQCLTPKNICITAVDTCAAPWWVYRNLFVLYGMLSPKSLLYYSWGDFSSAVTLVDDRKMLYYYVKIDLRNVVI